MDQVARILTERPEGVLLHEIPCDQIISRCTDFVSATGRIGDVYFVHPHMIHTWSVNELPVARFITNQPVTLRSPMQFDRADPADHSPVERVVLRALGADRYPFRPTAARQQIVPERIARDLAEQERRRAEVLRT